MSAAQWMCASEPAVQQTLSQCFAHYNLLELKFDSDWISSYAMQRAGAMVFVNVMRIPCFGRRMTMGRASIVWPGAN